MPIKTNEALFTHDYQDDALGVDDAITLTDAVVEAKFQFRSSLKQLEKGQY